MMKIFVGETSEAMGAAAAKLIAEKINEAIKEHGEARIVLSTGSSQFETMSPYQIMQCKCIVSAVPHNVKANAIFNLLAATQTSNMVPATLLKEHSDFNLFIDADSASMCTKDML